MVPDCGRFNIHIFLNLYFRLCELMKQFQLKFLKNLVPCAVGTYYDQTNKTCNPCPQGSYQSETGQLQCLRCPNIAGRIGVTAGSGARSAADCKGIISTNLLLDILYQ